MDWDDIAPKAPKRDIVIGEALNALSLGELAARIEALKAEINRVEAEIALKQKHEAAASALFKR